MKVKKVTIFKTVFIVAAVIALFFGWSMDSNAQGIRGETVRKHNSRHLHQRQGRTTGHYGTDYSKLFKPIQGHDAPELTREQSIAAEREHSGKDCYVVTEGGWAVVRCQ